MNNATQYICPPCEEPTDYLTHVGSAMAILGALLQAIFFAIFSALKKTKLLHVFMFWKKKSTGDEKITRKIDHLKAQLEILQTTLEAATPPSSNLSASAVTP